MAIIKAHCDVRCVVCDVNVNANMWHMPNVAYKQHGACSTQVQNVHTKNHGLDTHPSTWVSGLSSTGLFCWLSELAAEAMSLDCAVGLYIEQ